MNVNSMGVFGQQLANEQIKVQGQMVISMVAQAQAAGDQARAQTLQSAPETKVAPPPPGQGANVDISA